MKKITIIAGSLFCTMAALAAVDISKYEKIPYKTAPESAYRAVYNEVMGLTNVQDVAKIITATAFWGCDVCPNVKPETIAEFDEGLASRFAPNIAPTIFSGTFPKLATARAKHLGLDKMFPATFALQNRLKIKDASYAGGLLHYGAMLEDIITVLNEMVQMLPDIARSPLHEYHVKSFKQVIQTQASRSLKRKLREKGISFVAKNGKNPIVDYMTRLNAALDAPYFAGLNEWLSELGYDVQIDKSKFMTAEQVKELRDKVFYGDIEMTERVKATLLISLGVDGYNQFVKEYNGDK